METPSAGKASLVYWNCTPVQYVLLLLPSRFKPSSPVHKGTFTVNIVATVLEFNGERFAFGIGAMNDVLWVVPLPFINVVATGFIGYKTWYALIWAPGNFVHLFCP